MIIVRLRGIAFLEKQRPGVTGAGFVSWVVGCAENVQWYVHASVHLYITLRHCVVYGVYRKCTLYRTFSVLRFSVRRRTKQKPKAKSTSDQVVDF